MARTSDETTPSQAQAEPEPKASAAGIDGAQQLVDVMRPAWLVVLAAVAGLALTRQAADRRVLLSASLAVFMLSVYRLACTSVATIWLAADGLGREMGKGSVTVIGFASRFTDGNMGVTGDTIPDAALRKVYDLPGGVTRRMPWQEADASADTDGHAESSKVP